MLADDRIHIPRNFNADVGKESDSNRCHEGKDSDILYTTKLAIMWILPTPRPNYNLVYQKFVYSFKVMISTVITLRNHCTVTSVADCYPTKLSSKLPKINGVDFVKKRENILTVKIADHYKRGIDQKNKECPEHPSQAASLARGS